MGRPVRYPSRSDTITFPVFALTWHGNSTYNPKVDPTKSYNPVNCNVLAYCGGGGSAATGVGNTVQIQITTEQFIPREDGTFASTTSTRNHVVDTEKQIGVSVAIFQHCQGLEQEVRFLVAVGDEVWLYSLSLVHNNAEVVKVGSVLVGKGFGTNAVAFHPLGEGFVVGCENGQVLRYKIVYSENGSTAEFVQEAAMIGHVKAVCSVKYHPRGLAVLSSAKDGTCRVWKAKTQNSHDDNYLLHALECYNITQEEQKRSPNPQKGRKPGQILVRGCAFGDLEGKIVYTVQSGRRGGAFLSRWHLVLVQDEESKQQQYVFREVSRNMCSPCPVSAMDISGDGSTITLGAVDGSIMLYSTNTMSLLKKWDEVHDLPITCIAARPLPTSLIGELDNVRMNAITASADNKLSFVTTERRRKPSKPKSGSSSSHGFLFWVWLIIALAFMGLVCKESLDTCENQIYSFDLPAAFDCIQHSALWAPPTAPGVMFVPH